MQEFFKVNDRLEIQMPKGCINDTVKDIVYGFFYRAVEISYIPTDDLCIKIGNPTAETLQKGEGYISVTQDGVYITAIDERALLTSLFLLLRKAQALNLEIGKEEILIPAGKESVQPKISRRMIHFCVVPNVPLSVYKKLLRLASVLGYTQIILEFWGTFRYDCLKELAWEKQSFSKAEITELLQEAKDLQVEVVPMVNSFGHASASRMVFGKHVVLDQNPRLAPLFSSDGWRWNFERAEVKALLGKMRKELYEVFGEGKYFHIGFDEGFSYPWDERSTNALCDYLKALCEEVLQEGKTPMLWADQLLHEPTLGISLQTGYEGNAPTQEIAEKLLNSLPQETVLCDWQYFVKETPWKSAKYLAEKGRKVMVCPCNDIAGFNTSVSTAEELNCYGVLQTTWDKVFSEGAVYALFHAHDLFYGRSTATKKVGNRLEDATLLRKICFAKGDYKKAGWVQCDFNNVFSL